MKKLDPPPKKGLFGGGVAIFVFYNATMSWHEAQNSSENEIGYPTSGLILSVVFFELLFSIKGSRFGTQFTDLLLVNIWQLLKTFGIHRMKTPFEMMQ